MKNAIFGAVLSFTVTSIVMLMALPPGRFWMEVGVMYAVLVPLGSGWAYLCGRAAEEEIRGNTLSDYYFARAHGLSDNDMPPEIIAEVRQYIDENGNPV